MYKRGEGENVAVTRGWKKATIWDEAEKEAEEERFGAALVDR